MPDPSSAMPNAGRIAVAGSPNGASSAKNGWITIGETDSPAVNMPLTHDRSQFGGDFCFRAQRGQRIANERVGESSEPTCE